MTPEEALPFEKLDLGRLPRHVAVIMDGNGRWRRSSGTCRAWPATAPAPKRLRTTIETCARMKIEALTLYAFSVENWRRPKTEIDFLMQLLREYLRREMPLLQKNDIRMKFLGRTDEDSPAECRTMCATPPLATQPENKGMVLCVALNYGGRAEIVDAMNAILAEQNGRIAGRAPRLQKSRSPVTCTRTGCRTRTC